MLSAIDIDSLTGQEISVGRCQEENAADQIRAGFLALDCATLV